MGVKLKSKTHLLNTFFDFFSRFLRVRLQSLQKVLIWPPKLFSKNIRKEIKKRIISRWFQIRWKSCKKCTKKSYKQKKVWWTWVKSEKGFFSVTFLLITFLWCFFPRFLAPIDFLKIPALFILPHCSRNSGNSGNFINLLLPPPPTLPPRKR